LLDKPLSARLTASQGVDLDPRFQPQFGDTQPQITASDDQSLHLAYHPTAIGYLGLSMETI
jgi:hypothetical protein